MGLSPVRSGVSWVVVEFDEILVDWGSFRGLAPLDRLLEHYVPDRVLVPEIAREWAAIERIRTKRVPVASVSEEMLHREFSKCGAYTEKERVEALANQFPVLQEHTPTFAPWKREPERQAVFRALAVALAGRHA